MQLRDLTLPDYNGGVPNKSTAYKFNPRKKGSSYELTKEVMRQHSKESLEAVDEHEADADIDVVTTTNEGDLSTKLSITSSRTSLDKVFDAELSTNLRVISEEEL